MTPSQHPAGTGLPDLAPVIALGASPRATLALVRGAKSLALLRGRTYATPQDIFDLAPEVLRHRLILTYDALARDISIEHVLSRVLSSVPTMWVSPKPNNTGPSTTRSNSSAPNSIVPQV